MMIIDREKVRGFFAEYTGRYNADDPKIKLKIAHTYRVAVYCQRIAESLELPKEDVELAWLIGMLHDVGRFEQIRQYNTFSDGESVDHAGFGADILFKQRLIENFVDKNEPKEELDLVELSIRQHNAYRIKEGLSERETLFCNIIRDADKIDILRVNVETPLEEIYNVTTEEICTADVTPEVMAAFRKEHCVLRSLKKTAVDHIVGHASLVFELVFPISREIVASQDWIWRMLDLKTTNAATEKNFQEIRSKVRSFLNVSGLNLTM